MLHLQRTEASLGGPRCRLLRRGERREQIERTAEWITYWVEDLVRRRRRDRRAEVDRIVRRRRRAGRVLDVRVDWVAQGPRREGVGHSGDRRPVHCRGAERHLVGPRRQPQRPGRERLTALDGGRVYRVPGRVED